MSLRSHIDRYHDGTKHHFNRFARSLGYLDWAAQPRPFRSYEGALRAPLFPDPASPDARSIHPSALYRDLFGVEIPPSALTAAFLGDLLRHSLGLSAWKVAGANRWSLRVNPSSGNLHPTEAYVVCPALRNICDAPAVLHYAPDAHALELRCALPPDGWNALTAGQPVVLVALTSIHWREAWKYGERAFRYCQHDLGHAIAAVAIAARMHGWDTQLLPGWSHADLAAAAGLNRDLDFVEAEREEPGCLLALLPYGATVPDGLSTGDQLAALAGRGRWTGRASQLSEDHVEWSVIDDVAAASRSDGHALSVAAVRPASDPSPTPVALASPDARRLVLQRRSAVAFDGRSTLSAASFFSMLSRLIPGGGAPWTTIWWSPRIHLLLFVHRVEGLAPGLYLFERSAVGGASLRRAFGRELLEERVHDTLPLVCLGRGDCRSMARRLSCDQDIAADGFFSLGMLAEFDASVGEYGDAFYRHLFWESGVVGQMLYLEAEAAGVSGTGIGCFYDDAVHDVLGLNGHAFQSLYHFTIGMAVEDGRLTTERGYPWERSGTPVDGRHSIR